MAVSSAGVLLYRRTADGALVLLAHPGGPFFRRRDLGAWTIPKGEGEPFETQEETAKREFTEEIGVLPAGAFEPLGQIRQKGGKIVTAFALEGDFDEAQARSQSFELEWPSHSGSIARFPEIDRAEWFTLAHARAKISASQIPFLDRLEALLAAKP